MLSLKNTYKYLVYIIKVTSGSAMSMGIAQHKMKLLSRLYSLQVNIHPGNSGVRRIFAQTSGLVNSILWDQWDYRRAFHIRICTYKGNLCVH